MTERQLTLTDAVNQFDANRDFIEGLLPAGVSYNQFRSVATHALRSNPSLLTCFPPSLFNAFCKAAYDGLVPDGREAVIIIRSVRFQKNPDRYRPEAVYQSMVDGIRKIVIRDSQGLIHDIQATLVYTNEEFRIIRGLSPDILHEQIPDSSQRGDLLGVYAFARYTNGQPPTFEYLSKADIATIRASATSRDVWDKHTGEMWKKSAIRRLRKSLPQRGPVRDADQDEMFRSFAPNPDMARLEAEGQPRIAPPRPKRSDFEGGQDDQERNSRALVEERPVQHHEIVEDHQLAPATEHRFMNYEEILESLQAAETAEELTKNWLEAQPFLVKLTDEQVDGLRLAQMDRAADLAADVSGGQGDSVGAS